MQQLTHIGGAPVADNTNTQTADPRDPTHDITHFTKARQFGDIGKKTEAFVGFSTVAGKRGVANTERDIRGFAVKFHTEEGNWDLVGNNTPAFFLRDPLRFPT